jgi:hypothetical protein
VGPRGGLLQVSVGSYILLWRQRNTRRFAKNSTCVRSLVRAWVSREEIEHQRLGEVAYDSGRALARAQSLWVFRVHWVLPRVHYKESVNT